MKTREQVILEFIAHIVLAAVSVFVALVIADAVKELAAAVALTA